MIDPVLCNDGVTENVEASLYVDRLMTHATITLQDFVLFLPNFFRTSCSSRSFHYLPVLLMLPV